MLNRDVLFQHIFSRLFVYNILWEDAEVDETYLDLDEDSTVLGISAAGCGLAGMMARRPRSIDAVDINSHHLALAGLKMTAARRMDSWSEFYDLFGRGWSPQPEQTVRGLSQELPEWMQRYWKRHWRRFRHTVYHRGMTARMLWALRRLGGVDASWLRQVSRLPAEARVRKFEDELGAAIHRALARSFVSSPAQLVALGINYEQRDRMLQASGSDSVLHFIVEHFKRVAATDLSTNWFAWTALAGQFNHDEPDAVPPYLRRDRHEASLDAPTFTRFHHGNLFEVMESAGPDTWSHYTMCDAPDWMTPTLQRRLLSNVLRTARPGAKLLVRSVEDEGIVERHDMLDHFRYMAEESAQATALDRSRQYRRVAFYQVAEA